ARRTPSRRPGVARERVNYRFVYRRHRCPCVLKQCACTLKARRWAHSALAGAERASMHLVRPLADTPCQGAFPLRADWGQPVNPLLQSPVLRRVIANAIGLAPPA